MTAPCPRCKKASPLHFRTRDLNRRISNDSFAYYRCQSCKLIFLSPIPGNLGDYYPPDYYTGQPTLEQLKSAAEADRYKIELIQRFVRTGRLLEIGSAWGPFAYLAKQEGYEVEVVEMDRGCCAYLNEVVGVRAVNEPDVCTALSRLGPFNVVALWHVIEHIIDPWAALEAIAEVLLPGGIVIMAAPNPAALQFRILRRFWAHVDAPRHVELIPASLLEKQMASLGLKLVLSTTTDQGSIGWNGFGWQVSLANFFTRPSAQQAARRMGLRITRLLASIEGRNGLGSAYTLIFRKE